MATSFGRPVTDDICYDQVDNLIVFDEVFNYMLNWFQWSNFMLLSANFISSYKVVWTCVILGPVW